MAEAIRELYPGVDGTRHGDRIPAMFRHVVVAGEPLGCPGCRRSATAIESMDAVIITDNDESITANAVHRGFNHGERDGGCNRGIDCVSTVSQYLNAGLGCERL